MALCVFSLNLHITLALTNPATHNSLQSSMVKCDGPIFSAGWTIHFLVLFLKARLTLTPFPAFLEGCERTFPAFMASSVQDTPHYSHLLVPSALPACWRWHVPRPGRRAASQWSAVGRAGSCSRGLCSHTCALHCGWSRHQGLLCTVEETGLFMFREHCHKKWPRQMRCFPRSGSSQLLTSSTSLHSTPSPL